MLKAPVRLKILEANSDTTAVVVVTGTVTRLLSEIAPDESAI
jgi:hypothetical protein